MTALSTKPAVHSASFFNLFDDLTHGVEGLEDALTGLQDVRTQWQAAQHRLEGHIIDLQWTRCAIKAQQDRIELVSNHWFYGTTLLQPQLWFRGGCKGKIERAKGKLAKAEQEDLHTLLGKVQQMRTVQLPLLKAQLQRQYQRVEFSVKAVSELELMKQQAIQEYPTRHLLELQDQDEATGGQFETLQLEARSLAHIISGLDQARNIYQQAQMYLDDALETRKSTIESIQAACQKQEGGHDGQQQQRGNDVECDRELLSKEPGTQEKLDELRRMRQESSMQMQRQETECKQSISEALGHARHAEQVLANALNHIDMKLLERHDSLHGLVTNLRSMDPDVRFEAHYPLNRGIHIERLSGSMKHHQYTLSEQISVVEHVQSRVRYDIQNLKEQSCSVKSCLAEEQKRILDALREMVFGTPLPNTACLNPTAPPAMYDSDISNLTTCARLNPTAPPEMYDTNSQDKFEFSDAEPTGRRTVLAAFVPEAANEGDKSITSPSEDQMATCQDVYPEDSLSVAFVEGTLVAG